VWGKGFYDHALRRNESIRGVADYIIENPVRAGLARSRRAYSFWNTVWI